MVEWQQRERLAEKRVQLVIKLSRIFRAHWTDDSVHTSEQERHVFGGRAAAAREGLMMLIRAGWSVEMLVRLEEPKLEAAESKPILANAAALLPEVWCSLVICPDTVLPINSAWRHFSVSMP